MQTKINNPVEEYNFVALVLHSTVDRMDAH